MTLLITPKDALIIVDMQVDFLPGGTLPVENGDHIIPPINALTQRLPFSTIIATQDWHPHDHVSFEASGGPWPPHCIAGTPGANLSPDLDQTRINCLIRKGLERGRDSYSAFVDNDQVTETGLTGFLRGLKTERLFFCGLAYDFCVSHTALDARWLGFESYVIDDATRAISSDSYPTRHRLTQAGVHLTRSRDLITLPD